MSRFHHAVNGTALLNLESIHKSRIGFAAPELTMTIALSKQSNRFKLKDDLCFKISTDRATQLAQAIDRLRVKMRKQSGTADVKHLRRVSYVGRSLSVFGYATCIFGVQPYSIVLMALGRFTRWVLITHSVLHRSYDGLPELPNGWHSQRFARGWRRWIDWLDWIQPEDWQAQHNTEHHCYTGDERDPDRLSVNLHENQNRGPGYRLIMFLLLALTWKWTYYGPATLRATLRRRRSTDGQHQKANAPTQFSKLTRNYSPFVFWHFVLWPGLFATIDPRYGLAFLINTLVAELVSNAHSFLVIAATHNARDVPIFSGVVASREEFYLRQIIGTSNYHCNGPLARFFQGYMGYQIEHHLWPNAPLRQYIWLASETQALCQKYNIEYRKFSFGNRIISLVRATICAENPRQMTIEMVSPPLSLRRVGEALDFTYEPCKR